MRRENPNLEPDAATLAEMEARKAKIRKLKEQSIKVKAVEMKTVNQGRLDGISNRQRGMHE